MGSRRQPREAGKSPLNALERMDWEWIELGALTEDPRLQMRIEGLDEKHVRDLMATIEDKGIDDPITVIREGKTHWLGDGFHRVEAMRRVAGEQWQKQEIKAIVLTGTFDDAKQIARKANLRHGRALSSASRKAILFDMLRNNEEINGIAVKRLSNGVLAAELGVHADTISEWFKELIAESSTNGNPLVVLEDRQSVYSRDGKLRDVTGIQEKQQERAAELAERRAAEEAERKRNLPAVEKIRIVTQYLIAKYRDERAKRHTPLMDDPKRGFEWCYQVSNPASFVVDIDWERQFLHEYGAKPVNVYREFLRLADREVFTRADMDGWTDIQLEEWVREMGRRPPRQPNAATFQQTGMAQPKHPNIEVPQPKVLGRHYSSAPAAATETETHSTPTYDCPVRVGQRVKVIMTGEISYITATEWVDVEWRLLTESHPDDSLLLSDVEIVVPAEPELDTNSAPCPFKVGDRVILKRNPASANTVKSVRQLKDGTWQLTMTTAEGYEFYEVPSNLDFAPVESAVVVVEDPAVVPFRTGDIVRDIQSGELVEVIGFSSDGSITVESDDEDDEPYRYDGWAEDFEKYDTRADPPLKAVKSDGNRQAEIMIEDARTIIPRLLLESINATVDYRMTTLVRWESQKDMQTILENADDKELRRLLREAEHAITEFTTAQKGIQTAVNRCQDMVRQIQAVRQSA
ncbi:MAG: hypothetical protein F9K46_04385 [Anaerolineae bacterium]|nr:MAG: hypothetical protein F9K46_04385 [Anaerolineae bacterium]